MARPTIEITSFDESRSRRYRKRTEVLAFRSEAPLTFFKEWGEQKLPGGARVIVPLTEDGDPTEDLYGCEDDVFTSTYEPSSSAIPNRFRKKETVDAYQPGVPFRVDTVLADGHREVEGARSTDSHAWLVRNPGGELYIIDDEEFRRAYTEALESG